MGKVRFSYFDTHVQGTKKVLLATEKNVFAALNTRTGDLCKYSVLSFVVDSLPLHNIQLSIATLKFLFSSVLNVLVWRHVDKTGPEGSIDSLMLHGQGSVDITIYLSSISLPLFSVVNSLNYILL